MFDTKINGRHLDMFNAKLLDYTVGECDYKDGYLLPSARLIPEKLRSRIGLRPITLTVDFEGADIHSITLLISNLTAMLRKEARLLLPDGFNYWCEFDSASTPKLVAPLIMQVKFSLSGFRHGSMQHRTLTSTRTIKVEGNYETPARLVVTPAEGVTEFSVAGITVVNVTGTVTIDGIYTTIMDENGLNKYRDAPEMTVWPTLQPGENEIRVSDGVKVELSYYPIYQ